MGKHGKRQSQQKQRGKGRTFSYNLEEETYTALNSEEEIVSDEEENDGGVEEDNKIKNNNIPSKFWLYQQSVQVKVYFTKFAFR